MTLYQLLLPGLSALIPVLYVCLQSPDTLNQRAAFIPCMSPSPHCGVSLSLSLSLSLSFYLSVSETNNNPYLSISLNTYILHTISITICIPVWRMNALSLSTFMYVLGVTIRFMTTSYNIGFLSRTIVLFSILQNSQ